MAACPSCHSSISDADRFCSNCGMALHSALAPGGRRIEHRLVTAMYVDLVGSTGLAEELDPEDLSTVAAAVHDAVGREVEARDGTIGAFVGDGVLGVFGVPTAHDDDPLRALRAAEAVLERVAAIDERLGDRFGVEVAVRIGVSTGEILAPITDEPDVGTLTGDVLNVAARLQELAPSGGVVAAERTARSAPSFRFEDLGLLDVRGRARPVHGFLARGESESAAASLVAPFHGRTTELGRLQDVFRTVVAEGRPHVATVVGNAGVGKSRLVREFADWAVTADAALTTLWGRCLPYGQDLTYRPLADVLADLTGITSISEPAAATTAVESLVHRYAPDEEPGTATAALLGMIGLGGDAGPRPRRVRELLRTTWRSLMSGLASGGPVLLVIEDVHWAGEALLDLLGHVLRGAEGPLLVVCPARPEFTDGNPDWPEGFERHARLTLEPMEPAEAQRLAAHLLAEAGLPVAEAERIVERAGGNPFFIEELARELRLRRSDGADSGDELPATIQGVLSARIDLLRRPERQALQAASVVGRIFWPSAIEAITGTEPTELEAILRRLESLQLVRLSPRSSRVGESEYIFQHVLIREAAYARLSRRDLAHMHAALAEWLDHHGGEGDDANERLAYHTWRAHEMAAATSDLPEAEIDRLRTSAVQRLVDASRRARTRAAFGRARQLAELALSIAHGPVETAVGREQIGLVSLAEYDGEAAWASLREAVDLYLKAPEPDSAAIAAAVATAVEAPLRWRGTMRQLPPMEEVLRYVEIGMQHAGAEDSPTLASLLTAVSFAPTVPGQHGAVARRSISVDDGLAAAHRAREMAQRLGLPHIESAALDAIQAHAMWGGRVQEAAEIITERLRLADAVSDPWEVGDTYAMAALLAYDFGRYTLSRDRAVHGYKRTIEDAPNVALHNLSWAAVAQLQLGDWDEVMADLAIARRLLDPERKLNPPHFATPLFAAAAMVAEFRGHSADADDLLSVLDSVWASSDLAGRGGHPHARWVRHTAPIYLRRRDFDTVAMLVQSTDDAEPLGRENDRLSALCEFVAQRPGWEDVDEVLEETRATASAYGLSVLVAHAERLEGRASVATGDRRGGVALLEGARERFDSLGDHWEAGRTGLDLAEAGAAIDAGFLLRFFSATGAIDEIARTAAVVG